MVDSVFTETPVKTVNDFTVYTFVLLCTLTVSLFSFFVKFFSVIKTVKVHYPKC